MTTPIPYPLGVKFQSLELKKKVQKCISTECPLDRYDYIRINKDYLERGLLGYNLLKEGDER